MNRRICTVPEAHIAINSFKEEIAQEMRLQKFTYAGHVGGQMVKKMIEIAETELANQKIAFNHTKFLKYHPRAKYNPFLRIIFL